MTDGPIMDAINTYYDTHPDDEEKDARMAEEDTDLSLQDQEFDSVQERMTSEESERHDEFLVPPEGWQQEDFPQVTSDFVPHTSFTGVRPDPYITITPDGWIYIEVGNMRFAIPNEDEWMKLANMVARMINSWRANQDDFPPPTKADLDDFFATHPPPGETQEATAAVIGGIAAPKSFEDMIHRATQEMEAADQEAQTKESPS